MYVDCLIRLITVILLMKSCDNCINHISNQWLRSFAEELGSYQLSWKLCPNNHPIKQYVYGSDFLT